MRWRLSGAGSELSREATVAGVSGPQFRREGEGDAVQCGPCLAQCCHFGQQQVGSRWQRDADGLVGLAEAGERKRLAFGDWLISSRNQLDPVLFS